METSEDISLEFARLRNRLFDLEEQFNPHGADLRLGPPRNATVSPEFWDEVNALAAEGLEIVKQHRAYFMAKGDPPRMDSDGGFWPKLFVLVSAAGTVWTDKPVPPAMPLEAIESVLFALMEISEYTEVVPGETLKKNQEALTGFITAFPGLAPRADAYADRLPGSMRKGIIKAAAEAARKAPWLDLRKLM